jgi:hypothetical protein
MISGEVIMKFYKLAALPIAGLLNVLLMSPAQASLVCTAVSGPADPTTPYFNGDLTNPNCDITEIEDFLGLAPGSIDESLIVGSKTESFEDAGGDINSWAQDEFDLGTLTVTEYTNTTGTWELEGSITPLFWVDKYDGVYSVYTYMGDDTSPFSDSWNREGGRFNTSHISVYGVVPVPAAVWLFGSGLIGLIGIARRKRA